MAGSGKAFEIRKLDSGDIFSSPSSASRLACSDNCHSTPLKIDVPTSEGNLFVQECPNSQRAFPLSDVKDYTQVESPSNVFENYTKALFFL